MQNLPYQIVFPPTVYQILTGSAPLLASTLLFSLESEEEESELKLSLSELLETEPRLSESPDLMILLEIIVLSGPALPLSLSLTLSSDEVSSKICE